MDIDHPDLSPKTPGTCFLSGPEYIPELDTCLPGPGSMDLLLIWSVYIPALDARVQLSRNPGPSSRVKFNHGSEPFTSPEEKAFNFVSSYKANLGRKKRLQCICEKVSIFDQINRDLRSKYLAHIHATFTTFESAKSPPCPGPMDQTIYWISWTRFPDENIYTGKSISIKYTMQMRENITADTQGWMPGPPGRSNPLSPPRSMRVAQSRSWTAPCRQAHHWHHAGLPGRDVPERPQLPNK